MEKNEISEERRTQEKEKQHGHRLNIRRLGRKELTELLTRLGEPAYRANQLHRWLYSNQALRFEEMSTLSKQLRQKLASEWIIHPASLVGTERETTDASLVTGNPTAKFLIKLEDNELVESVLIPSEERITACISSQIGCPLRCTFCATGHMGDRKSVV